MYVWYELETGIRVYDVDPFDTEMSAIQYWHHNHPQHVSMPPDEGYVAKVLSPTGYTYVLLEVSDAVQ
jgi:hypothetical protein